MNQKSPDSHPVDLTVPTVRPRTMMVDELTYTYVPYHGGRTVRPLKTQPDGTTLPAGQALAGTGLPLRRRVDGNGQGPVDSGARPR